MTGAVDPPGRGWDRGYGPTPRDAIRSVLLKQPAFEPDEAEFVGEEPPFMDVKAWRVHRDDWEQYEGSDSRGRSNRGGPPTVKIMNRTPVREGAVPRAQISLGNIWLNVKYPNVGPDQSDESVPRADVLFSVNTMVTEPQFSGEDTASNEFESVWKAERISTEPEI